MLTQTDLPLQVKLTQVFSHEMLSPLTPILAYSAQMLKLEKGKMPEPDELREIHTSIHGNALRLQHLLENYLLYATLQILQAGCGCENSGTWTETSEFFPHVQIPEWTMGIAWKMQRQRDLSFEIPERLIVASPHSLQKIVDEVLRNALKFSEPGTPVRIVFSEEPQSWRLEISDRGRGMTPEQIANIGAFMQFDREQYEQQGVGLGLAIVQLLTQLQGGNFRITSAPGQGTTVRLEFPG